MKFTTLTLAAALSASLYVFAAPAPQPTNGFEVDVTVERPRHHFHEVTHHIHNKIEEAECDLERWAECLKRNIRKAHYDIEHDLRKWKKDLKRHLKTAKLNLKRDIKDLDIQLRRVDAKIENWLIKREVNALVALEIAKEDLVFHLLLIWEKLADLDYKVQGKFREWVSELRQDWHKVKGHAKHDIHKVEEDISAFVFGLCFNIAKTIYVQTGNQFPYDIEIDWNPEPFLIDSINFFMMDRTQISVSEFSTEIATLHVSMREHKIINANTGMVVADAEETDVEETDLQFNEPVSQDPTPYLPTEFPSSEPFAWYKPGEY